ncbi:MAG: hypothetical protein SFU25_05330 [Candidatus Caenarcaniphilales bacterium]|nr:hypothetical protein [Candidatus Caenarcaniphilales bacterium]
MVRKPILNTLNKVDDITASFEPADNPETRNTLLAEALSELTPQYLRGTQFDYSFLVEMFKNEDFYKILSKLAYAVEQPIRQAYRRSNNKDEFDPIPIALKTLDSQNLITDSFSNRNELSTPFLSTLEICLQLKADENEHLNL